MIMIIILIILAALMVTAFIACLAENRDGFAFLFGFLAAIVVAALIISMINVFSVPYKTNKFKISYNTQVEYLMSIKDKNILSSEREEAISNIKEINNKIIKSRTTKSIFNLKIQELKPISFDVVPEALETKRILFDKKE